MSLRRQKRESKINRTKLNEITFEFFIRGQKIDFKGIVQDILKNDVKKQLSKKKVKEISIEQYRIKLLKIFNELNHVYNSFSHNRNNNPKVKGRVYYYTFEQAVKDSWIKIYFSSRKTKTKIQMLNMIKILGFENKFVWWCRLTPLNIAYFPVKVWNAYKSKLINKYKGKL